MRIVITSEMKYLVQLEHNTTYGFHNRAQALTFAAGRWQQLGLSIENATKVTNHDLQAARYRYLTQHGSPPTDDEEHDIPIPTPTNPGAKQHIPKGNVIWISS